MEESTVDIPKHDPASLKALFDTEPLAPLSFGLDYAYGFILAMISAPDMIQPSEWFPMLFKSRELPEFSSKKQTETILGALISIWSFWAAETEDSETLTLSPDYGLEADGNPTPGLQAFCRGYLEGSEWLRELWDEALEGYGPESEEDKIAGTALYLCLYFCKERQLPEDSTAARELSAMPISEVWEQLPAALTDAAALGRALHMESLRASEPLKAPPTPGRNDPCPCGSGKKYKKCCLSKPLTSSSKPENR